VMQLPKPPPPTA